jgi:hypothetical protein
VELRIFMELEKKRNEETKRSCKEAYPLSQPSLLSDSNDKLVSEAYDHDIGRDGDVFGIFDEAGSTLGFGGEAGGGGDIHGGVFGGLWRGRMHAGRGGVPRHLRERRRAGLVGLLAKHVSRRGNIWRVSSRRFSSDKCLSFNCQAINDVYLRL